MLNYCHKIVELGWHCCGMTRTSNKDSAYSGLKSRIKLSLIVIIYYGKIAYGTIMIKYDVLLWPLELEVPSDLSLSLNPC